MIYRIDLHHITAISMLNNYSKYIIPFLFFFCFALHLESQNNKESYNILFIGNSLTFTNNLPALIKTKAKYSGYHLKTEMVALPNYSISDHWKKGDVQKLIKNNNYDIVILQQGPSSQSRGRKMLIDYGKKYSEICKENNTSLAYFMVWPSLDYYHTFEAVIKNHEQAAEINEAILFPVGSIWKKYFDASKKYDYYGSDSFHPSKKGSDIAAKVITKILIRHLN